MEMENKNTPIEEVTPKRRGRKPKAEAETNVEATPKKRGRKPKTDEEVPSVETPKKRTRRTKKEIEDALAEAVNETMPDAIAYAAEQDAKEKVAAVEDAPKKRGRKKKEENGDQTPPSGGEKVVNRKLDGRWNIDRVGERNNLSIIKDTLRVEIMLTSKALGMTPSNPESLVYVAQNPDEMDPFGDPETQNERSATIWPKAKFIPGDHDGCWTLVNEPGCPKVEADKCIQLPYIYDYQLRGMFKDACGLLSRAKNNESSNLKAYKKWIDGNIFTGPRKIAFNLPETYLDDDGVEMPTYSDGKKLQLLARPLRTSGPTGDRSAIAVSEMVPPGTSFKFEISVTDAKLIKVITEWLDYGLFRGIGQWRNSGIGTFVWRFLDENWMPFEDDGDLVEELENINDERNNMSLFDGDSNESEEDEE